MSGDETKSSKSNITESSSTAVPGPETPETNVRGRRERQKTDDPTNPFGLGNPDDQSLRKVEKEILIPKKMREKARTEKCVPEETDFSECCKRSSLAMVITCRGENTKLKNCLASWYQDEDFRKLCTVEYLRERSEYRRTGVKPQTGLSQRYVA